MCIALCIGKSLRIRCCSLWNLKVMPNTCYLQRKTEVMKICCRSWFLCGTGTYCLLLVTELYGIVPGCRELKVMANTCYLQRKIESFENPLPQLVEIESYGKHLLFAKENGKLWKSVSTACGNWKLWQALVICKGKWKVIKIRCRSLWKLKVMANTCYLQRKMESYEFQLVGIKSYGKHFLFARENGKLWKSVSAACGNWKLWQIFIICKGKWNVMKNPLPQLGGIESYGKHLLFAK